MRGASSSEKILRDLADSTPGKEGKWFAAAKNAGLFDKAIELAWESPPDLRTLARAPTVPTERVLGEVHPWNQECGAAEDPLQSGDALATE